MLSRIREHRIENENQYMALLLNKNDLFNFIQVKPEYLFLKENQVLLKLAIRCFEKNGCINLYEILEDYGAFNVEHFAYLLNEEFYYNSEWKTQMKLAEEMIVDFYKEDNIGILNKRLEHGEISYEEFIKKTKELDNIVLSENVTVLTKKEILENINTKKSRVNFNNFVNLNNMLQMVQGDFLIIGATTGIGKSGLMLNFMNDLMTGFQCIYFNMEMSKSTIYKRLVSINSGLTINDVENPKTEYQIEIIKQALEKIENAKLIVEHKANDIKQIRSVVAKLKDKNKHTVLFIDHLGLTKCDSTKNLYEQATEVAKQLRQMCLEYDCTVISAAQLNRSAYGSDSVTLNMLKDSGELENSASKVILLYKDKNANHTNSETLMNIEIAKNRDGICGIIPMKYDKTKQIFEEVRNDYRV